LPTEFQLNFRDALKASSTAVNAFILLILKLAAFLVFCYGAFYVWASWYSKTFKYEEQYGIDAAHVVVGDKPHNCEWDAAPLGNKYCHYEENVVVARDDAGKIKMVYVSWVKKSD
jgi:hypothetical protein